MPCMHEEMSVHTISGINKNQQCTSKQQQLMHRRMRRCWATMCVLSKCPRTQDKAAALCEYHSPTVYGTICYAEGDQVLEC